MPVSQWKPCRCSSCSRQTYIGDPAAVAIDGLRLQGGLFNASPQRLVVVLRIQDELARILGGPLEKSHVRVEPPARPARKALWLKRVSDTTTNSCRNEDVPVELRTWRPCQSGAEFHCLWSSCSTCCRDWDLEAGKKKERKWGPLQNTVIEARIDTQHLGHFQLEIYVRQKFWMRCYDAETEERTTTAKMKGVFFNFRLYANRIPLMQAK